MGLDIYIYSEDYTKAPREERIEVAYFRNFHKFNDYVASQWSELSGLPHEWFSDSGFRLTADVVEDLRSRLAAGEFAAKHEEGSVGDSVNALIVMETASQLIEDGRVIVYTSNW